MAHSLCMMDVLRVESNLNTVYLRFSFVVHLMCIYSLMHACHAFVHALLSATRLVQIQTLTLWAGASIYPTRGITLCWLQSRGCRSEWI